MLVLISLFSKFIVSSLDLFIVSVTFHFVLSNHHSSQCCFWKIRGVEIEKYIGAYLKIATLNRVDYKLPLYIELPNLSSLS